MPNQDFTLNTNVDPGGHLTSITANRIDFTGLDYDGDCYSYFNYGVGHFNSDFSHLLNFEITANPTVGGLVAIWMLTNDVANMKVLQDTGKYFQEVIINGDQLRLVKIDSAGTTVDAFVISLNTRYYLNIYWIGSIVYCGIYSDSIYSTLLDTLSVGFTDSGYENLFSTNNFNLSAFIASITGDVSDLDLQEVAGFQAAWARNSNLVIGSGIL